MCNMNFVSNEIIPSNLHILDAKSYDKWGKKMKVLFSYQSGLEVIKNGVNSLVKGATVAEQATHKEHKKKDFKVLFLIHQCMDGDKFEKVDDCELSKQAWKILENAYVGVGKANMVRLQTRKRQLELIQMGEKETINDFTTRITRLVNQVKSCGETVT